MTPYTAEKIPGIQGLQAIKDLFCGQDVHNVGLRALHIRGGTISDLEVADTLAWTAFVASNFSSCSTRFKSLGSAVELPVTWLCLETEAQLPSSSAHSSQRSLRVEADWAKATSKGKAASRIAPKELKEGTCGPRKLETSPFQNNETAQAGVAALRGAAAACDRQTWFAARSEAYGPLV